MYICGYCGRRLLRVRRSFWQRPIYAAVYECESCKRREVVQRGLALLFSLDSRCPRCGNRRLERHRKRDHIETLHRGWFSRIQRWFGAGLHYCSMCRLEFYDFRRIAPAASNSEEATGRGSA